MVEKTMPNWLYQRAFLTPDRIALEFNQQSMTFKELHDQAMKVARKLATLHVRKGDYVAFLLENSIETVTLIRALEYIGAIIVPLNHRLTPTELRYQLLDSGASLVVYAERFAMNAREAASAEAKIKTIEIKELLNLIESPFQMRKEIHLHDVHTIMYTSGTTGSPKGVILTYSNHWWSAIGSSLNLGLHANDRWLCVVPMFHMSGLSILMRNVIYGIPVLIHDRFEPNRVNESIQAEGVTIVSVVSAMLTTMVHTLTEPYPDTFRCMLLGGGPAPQPLLEACVKKNIPVFQTYGMTETASQFVTLSAEYMLTKLGSAGKPLFQSQLKIDVAGREAAPHEVGEIVVKGANVTNGYLHRPVDTAQAIKDGWLYTGDLGYVDEDGFLYVLDRRSDLIISGGENIYPAEIEATLLSHPAILEAGVTGMPHDKWGQVPLAFVVTHKDTQLTAEALQAFCEEKLAPYKVPKEIHFVAELPRNGANKLLRRKLLQLREE